MSLADDILSAVEPHDTNTTTVDPAAGNTPRPGSYQGPPAEVTPWYEYLLASPNNPIVKPVLERLGVGPNAPNAPPSPWPSAVKWIAGGVVAVAGVVGFKVAADAWRDL